jgi:hypothetical protein
LKELVLLPIFAQITVNIILFFIRTLLRQIYNE